MQKSDDLAPEDLYPKRQNKYLGALSSENHPRHNFASADLCPIMWRYARVDHLNEASIFQHRSNSPKMVQAFNAA